MKINETNIEGLILIEPDVFPDDRGYFFESLNLKKYEVYLGQDLKFVQDNISRSIRNTIRGLHFQVGEKAQGKLCQVFYGSVLDVAVDIRPDSSTFGQYYSKELSEENHLQLWIPPGFAHGFAVLSDSAIFSYKCTEFYSKEHERAIYYADEDLNIDWGIPDPIISEKDKKAPKFREYIAYKNIKA